MQTQTQRKMQASSHVQRKRKEREIRKRSRSIFPRWPTMIELLPIHTCGERTQIQTSENENVSSYKLLCYTKISSPEESVFDIANQLLTRYTPFAPLGQVDERTAKPSPFSIQGRLSEYFPIMAAGKLKYQYRRLQTVTLKLS